MFHHLITNGNGSYSILAQLTSRRSFLAIYILGYSCICSFLHDQSWLRCAQDVLLQCGNFSVGSVPTSTWYQMCYVPHWVTLPALKVVFNS